MIDISNQEKLEIINNRINNYTSDYETMNLYLNNQEFINEMGEEYMYKFNTLMNDISAIISILYQEKSMLA